MYSLIRNVEDDIEAQLPPIILYKNELLVKCKNEVKPSEFWDGILQDTNLTNVIVNKYTTLWDEFNELFKLSNDIFELIQIIQEELFSLDIIYEKTMKLDDLFRLFIYKQAMVQKFLKTLKKHENLKLLLHVFN
jgi:hypothetical protein